MKTRFILSVFVVIAVAFLMIASPVSAEIANGGDDIIAAAQTNTEATVSTSVENGSDEGVYATPVNGEGYTDISNGSDDDAGANPDAIVTSTQNGGDDATFVAPVVSPLTTTTGSTPSSVSGGSSSGRSHSSVRPNNIVALAVNGSACPLITSKLLKVGGSNNAADVTRLQTFLKEIEKLDVDVNGTFDAKTEAAVKVFQVKHKDTVLVPWKATRASGIAYITTIKKINELACGSALTMNAEEMAIINAYSQNSSVNSAPATPNTNNAVIGATPESTVAIDNSTETEANTATVSDAPVLKRFWNFIVGLFR